MLINFVTVPIVRVDGGHDFFTSTPQRQPLNQVDRLFPLLPFQRMEALQQIRMTACKTREASLDESIYAAENRVKVLLSLP
jgi:hypothetical protein